MEHTRRSIIFASLIIFGLTILAVIAAVLVPFAVDREGTISAVSGLATLQLSSGDILELEPDTPDMSFKPGNILLLQPDAGAYVVFEINGGHATIAGPAHLRLVDSYRRATLIGHILDTKQFKREYVLVIEQTLGSARYNFANTTPSFDDLAITIRLPGSSYRPTAPCWEVTVSATGNTESEPVECSGG